MNKKSKATHNTASVVDQVLQEARTMAYPPNLRTDIAESIKLLDAYFGEGYAGKNPSVLAACIQHHGLTASATHGEMIDNVAALARSLEELAAAVQGRNEVKG